MGPESHARFSRESRRGRGNRGGPGQSIRSRGSRHVTFLRHAGLKRSTAVAGRQRGRRASSASHARLLALAPVRPRPAFGTVRAVRYDPSDRGRCGESHRREDGPVPLIRSGGVRSVHIQGSRGDKGHGGRHLLRLAAHFARAAQKAAGKNHPAARAQVGLRDSETATKARRVHGRPAHSHTPSPGGRA